MNPLSAPTPGQPAAEQLYWLQVRDDIVAALFALLFLLAGLTLYAGVVFFAFHHNEAATTACALFGAAAFAGCSRLVRRVVSRCKARRRLTRQTAAEQRGPDNQSAL